MHKIFAEKQAPEGLFTLFSWWKTFFEFWSRSHFCTTTRRARPAASVHHPEADPPHLHHHLHEVLEGRGDHRGCVHIAQAERLDAAGGFALSLQQFLLQLGLIEIDFKHLSRWTFKSRFRSVFLM